MILSVSHPGPSLVSPHSSDSLGSSVPADSEAALWGSDAGAPASLPGWWMMVGSTRSWHLSRACPWLCVCHELRPTWQSPWTWDLVPGHIPMPTLHRVQRGTYPASSTSIFLSSESGFYNLQQYFHYEAVFSNVSYVFRSAFQQMRHNVHQWQTYQWFNLWIKRCKMMKAN